MQRRDFIRTAGLLCAALTASARAAASPSLSFGILPQFAPAELARAWVPLIRLLAARSGLDLRFATTPDIPSFEARLAAGEYDFAYMSPHHYTVFAEKPGQLPVGRVLGDDDDAADAPPLFVAAGEFDFAYMNPYHYTVFAEKPGYVAFAHEKGRRIGGIIVVAKDAPYRQLADLAGHEIAHPAPRSFAATLLVRAELARAGIATLPKYVGSHESVYLNVAQGLIAAGGGIPRTLEAMDAPVRARLRLLWSSPLYTPHALAAHPRVPAAAVAALRAAMIGADADAEGREALRGVAFLGIQAARHGDWDDVRALRLPGLAAAR